MHRIYLLSPANCAGKRAGYLLNERATFDLAIRLQQGQATLGECFSFMSGLYFRGKLAYARRFASPPPGAQGVWVIAPGQGLLAAGEVMTLQRLRAMGKVPVDVQERRYRRPLLAALRALATTLDADDRVVLLGSIATGKYTDLLRDVLGDRLHFPAEFVGRGDMSRGGLLLRQVDAGEPLVYLPLRGATLHGKRPPKLTTRMQVTPVEADH